MSSPEDPFGLVGTRLDGKYDIESAVAQGGFGVVYRATHRGLSKTVAVKVLKVPPDLAGAARKMFLDRFAQEAKTIAAFDHPAIVRVLDFGASPMPEGEAARWMVLEWLTGVTFDADLEARRAQGGQAGRAPAECLALLRPVFEALAYAHDEGIVHRDIKPENLMIVTNKRGERTVRVLDFGIAKAMGDEEASSSGQTATRTQQRAFSLYYASPEQLSGMRTGPWTDVYALALVLTELLTDWPPYDGDDVSDVYADVLSLRRPTPAKRGFDVGMWETVIARAVAIKPAERFANARELLTALDASVPAVVRAPSLAPPTPTAAQDADTLNDSSITHDMTPRKQGSRRAPLLGIAAVAALGVIVGTASYLAATRASPTTAHVARAPLPTPAATPAAPTTIALPPVAQIIVPSAPIEIVSADTGVAPIVATPARPRMTARPAPRRPPPRVAVPTPTVTLRVEPVAPTRRVTGHETVPTE